MMLGALRPMCVYVFADASLLAYAIGKCNEKQRRECRAPSRQTSSLDISLFPHRKGRVGMSVVLTDLLLFICVALFLTGIMIASAILVG